MIFTRFSIIPKSSISNCVRFASGSRIAVVGSGPAGLFTCASILRRSDASIDVFDASPVPFGLVRYGVAPDHQDVKNCINGFNKMFNSHTDRLSLFCNVRVARDISFEELTSSYDAVLLAYGAQTPRRLQIPGANSKNVLSGSEFVSWYSGVPNTMKPNLDCEDAVVIGNGNVALDCARIISSGHGPKSILRETDVPTECLDLLERSGIKRIKIVGRRGPLNVSFTIKELREQFKVKDWNAFVNVSEKDKQLLEDGVLNGDRRRKRLLKVLLDGVKDGSDGNSCEFLFHRTPVEVLADSQGSVSAIKFLNNETKQEEVVPCGLLIYSIGFQTLVLDGVPKTEKGEIDMKDEFRVRMPDDSNVYAVGWCASGAHGVIVDTQQHSQLISQEVINDLTHNDKKNGVQDLLVSRKIPYVSWSKWLQIDSEEQEQGRERGKIREKIQTFEKYIK